MKLRYLTMGLSNEAIKQMGLERNGQLARESAYISEYVLREVNKNFKFDCGRINLICQPDTNYTGTNVFTWESIFSIDIPFSLEYFSLTEKCEKEQFLYETFRKGLMLLCETKKWDFAIFESALKSLKDRNFNVDFVHKVKQSPDKKTVAKLYCVQTMNEATFYVDFYIKNKLSQRKPCMVTSPEYMLYALDLSKLIWKNNETVQILDIVGNITKEITMD
ncbi:MAG: hypothetical protein II987_05890 [Clostridia bacterium]|nr:hypothetical protein [Clostridia bacterium]